MNTYAHGSEKYFQKPFSRFGRDAVERVLTSFMVTRFGSAGWQPAVSPTGSLQGVEPSQPLRITNPRHSRLPVCATVAPLPLLFLLFAPLLSSGQTNDAISREISFFNFGQASASVEAISRELSYFNFGTPSANVEAISREVSYFNFGVPSATNEAISREVSYFNFGEPSATVEAISREVSYFNYGVPPVAFTVGSTNALKDVPNQVPFNFQTVLDLTNLSLTLQSDDSHLQILGVTSASPEVLATTLGTVTANNHPITFTLNPAAIPTTNHVLAYLNFQGITNLESAIVPLTINNFSANRTSGQFAPGAITNGQVILIVNQPILFPTNRLPLDFTMYGIPGATYAIQATTNLAPAFWIEVQRMLESGPTLSITGLTNRGSQQFYRAQQVGP